MSVEISEVPIESGVERGFGLQPRAEPSQVDEDKQIQENTETNQNNENNENI